MLKSKSTVALDVDASVTVFQIRLGLVPDAVDVERLVSALQQREANGGPSDLEAMVDTGYVQIRIYTHPAVAASSLKETLQLLEKVFGSPLPLSVIGRGPGVEAAMSSIQWPARTGYSLGAAMPPSPPGMRVVFERGRFKGRIAFRAAPVESPRHVVQSVVSSAWLGARDSVVMRRVRERAGLVYFPSMAYDWHREEPAWTMVFEAEAESASVLRDQLYEAACVPVPHLELTAHVQNISRSLDVVEIAPEAQIALAQQAVDRGLSQEWLVGFRASLAAIDEESFAFEWVSMMTRVKEALDEHG